jgi:hypothetical protein
VWITGATLPSLDRFIYEMFRSVTAGHPRALLETR